jgi:hypothetical protein
MDEVGGMGEAGAQTYPSVGSEFFFNIKIRITHSLCTFALQEPAASMQYLLLVLKAIVAEVKREDTVYVVDWDGDNICFNIREEQVGYRPIRCHVRAMTSHDT